MNNRGYLRRKLKWEAKRLLSGRWLFCLTMLLFWGILWYVTQLYSGGLGPALPGLPGDISDPAQVDAYLTAWFAAWRSIEPARIAGLLLTAALGFLLRTPLDVGIAANYLALSREEQPRLRDSFAFYIGPGQLTRSLLAELLCLFWRTLYVLPFFVFSFTSLWIDDPLVGLPLSLLAMALLAWGLVRAGAYAQARYLLAARPELGPREIVRLSVRNMRGRLWDYAVFQLSFLPWLVLISVTMLLGALYFMPYYHMCQALYMRKTWESCQ